MSGDSVLVIVLMKTGIPLIYLIFIVLQVCGTIVFCFVGRKTKRYKIGQCLRGKFFFKGSYHRELKKLKK